MTPTEERLRSTLARLVGQARGVGLRDRLGHTFERNAALVDAEQLLAELETPDAAYRYMLSAVADVRLRDGAQNEARASTEAARRR